ncbi:hypothetical protein OG874_00570 [Nocardia sp. NBC_00565]|nr:hypothetical protein [Nocardia sp. NBC_00565]WUC03749.1 hypothetical protein OG874_00570 [Nocardia sp. NBC_00565]
MPAPATEINFGLSLEDQCEQIWLATREQERRQERMRQADPVVRLFDAEMRLQHLVRNEYGQNLVMPSNDTGSIELPVPFDSPVGQWLWEEKERLDRGEGKNINIIVEYCGSRIGGLIDTIDLDLDEKTGDQIITPKFLTDMERLKWYSCWSNPWFPEWIQWPQVFICPGPITWVLSLMLDLQIQREAGSSWAVASDPMDGAQRGDLDQSTYSMVVKPISFIEAMASGVLWGIAISRFKNFAALAKPMMDDGEVCAQIDIFMEGDPEPWPGANLRPGTRIVRFEDRSGTYSGTSHGGTIWDGLIRTVDEFVGDMIDSTTSIITGATIPPEYYDPNAPPRTQKILPFAVWRDGEISGLDRYKYRRTHSKGIQVVTGGHSMPGVVGAPTRKGLGHRRSRQSMNLSRPQYKWPSTSCRQRSLFPPLGVVLTPCWPLSIQMRCSHSWWRAVHYAPQPKAGPATSNCSRPAAERRTPSPPCWSCVLVSGRQGLSTPSNSVRVMPARSSSAKPGTYGWMTAADSRSAAIAPAASTWTASPKSNSPGTGKPNRRGPSRSGPMRRSETLSRRRSSSSRSSPTHFSSSVYSR